VPRGRRARLFGTAPKNQAGPGTDQQWQAALCPAALRLCLDGDGTSALKNTSYSSC